MTKKDNKCDSCGKPVIILRPIYLVEQGELWLCNKCYDLKVETYCKRRILRDVRLINHQ